MSGEGVIALTRSERGSLLRGWVGCVRRKVNDIRIVRVRCERIPEEDQAVDATLSNPCPDLLVSAERAALKPAHLDSEILLEQKACCAGRKQLMLGQELTVEARPLQ